MKSKNKLLCVLTALMMFFLSSNCVAKNDKTQKEGEMVMEEKTNILKAFPTIQSVKESGGKPGNHS